MRCWQQASLLNKTLKIAKMMLKSGVKSSLILKICQTEQSNLKIETMRHAEWLQNRYCSTNKCLLNKPKQRSIVKKDPIFTLNIPEIRCKTPWNMRRKWAFVIQFAGGWGTHSGKNKANAGWMIKMATHMIKTSKIHELITYSANVLLSTLSPVNMRATLLRFIESWKNRKKWRFLLRNFFVE